MRRRRKRRTRRRRRRSFYIPKQVAGSCDSNNIFVARNTAKHKKKVFES
jgi:hypothetical protein